jgi:hypothetical protein
VPAGNEWHVHIYGASGPGFNVWVHALCAG